jgi:DNA-binding MarR family transcriptional regulator
MQVSRRFERLVQAMAPSGNLFFLITLQELRRQGLTFLAFYILQRTIEEREFFELWVRRETGLDDYEVSRACTFLARSGLIEKKKYGADARVRVLTATDRGVHVLNKILSTAAERLKEGVPRSGRLRRVSEAAQLLQEGNRILLGPLQLSFFDTDLCEEEPSKSVRKKRKARKPAQGRLTRSEP